MALTNIQVVSIPVADQERAKAFYADTLGFELMRDDSMGDGQRWVQLRPAGAATSITLVTWFEKMPPGSLTGLVLETDDLHADHARLAAEGVRFQGPIEDAPWGSYALFDDPDGNSWVLQGRPGGPAKDPPTRSDRRRVRLNARGG